jgi:hypothetical protein
VTANNCKFGMCSSKAALTGTCELITIVASLSCSGLLRALPSVITLSECGKAKSGTLTQESRATMWCLNVMLAVVWRFWMSVVWLVFDWRSWHMSGIKVVDCALRDFAEDLITQLSGSDA